MSGSDYYDNRPTVKVSLAGHPRGERIGLSQMVSEACNGFFAKRGMRSPGMIGRMKSEIAQAQAKRKEGK